MSVGTSSVFTRVLLYEMSLDEQFPWLFLLLEVPLTFPGFPGLKGLLFIFLCIKTPLKLILYHLWISFIFSRYRVTPSRSLAWAWGTCILTPKLSLSRESLFFWKNLVSPIPLALYTHCCAGKCHLLVRCHRGESLDQGCLAVIANFPSPDGRATCLSN